MGDNQGRVIWITGLSGAGKTTLAQALQKELPGSILLDGDALRSALAAENCGFDPENRKKLAFTYARLARMLAIQGFTVIMATISCFHELHAWNRKHLPGYLEIFLDIPGEILQKRDPKGLYAACANDMAGVGHEAQLPQNPHLRFYPGMTLAQEVAAVMRALRPAFFDI